MADDVGGIRGEVTADAAPLYAVLQQAAEAYRRFDQQYGRMVVRIEAQMPTQQQFREHYQTMSRTLQQVGALQVPIQLVPPTQEDVRRATRPAAETARAAAPTVPAVVPQQIARETPIAAPVAAERSDAILRAEAQARANTSGARVQYRTAAGGLATVYPTGGGGPVGGGGGLAVGGVPLGPGAQGFAGNIGGNDPRFLEEAALNRRRVAELEVENASLRQGGLSPAQLEQRRTAGLAGFAAVSRGPGGRFVRREPEEEAPLINPTPEEREAQLRERVNLPTTPPIVRRTPVVQARAAEERPFEELGLPPSTFPGGAEGERLLAASQGVVGTPAEQRRAQERIDALNIGRASRGGGGPRGPTNGRLPAAPRLTEEQRLDVASRNPQLAEGLQFLQQSRELSVQAQAGVQQRSLGTFITGLLQAGSGRPASVIAIREQNAAVTDYGKALDNTARAQKAVENSQDALAKAHQDGASNIEQLTTNYQKYLGQLDEAETHQAAARQRVIETSKALGEQGSALRGLAAGFAGGIAGSFAYGIGITAVSGAIDVLGRGLERGIDLLTGHTAKTQQYTSELSDQARAQNGLTSLVVAQSFAQSGLSSSVANSIRPIIEQRVALEAGSKAFSDQIDQIRSYQNLLEAQRQGRFPGISEGTGGVLGTQLFAQPGVIEQLAGLTPRGEGRETGGVVGALGGAGAGALAGSLFGPGGTLVGGLLGALLGGGAGFLAGREIGGALGGIGGGGGLGIPSPEFAARAQAGFPGPTPGQFANVGPLTAAQAEGGLTPFGVGLTLAIDQMNSAAKRAGPSLNGVSAALDRSDQAAQAREATARQLEAAFPTLDPQRITDLKEAGFVLQNVAGADLKTQAVNVQDFFKAVTEGSALPDPQETLARLRNQILPARAFALGANLGLQQQGVQIAAGIATAAAPPLPPGATIPGGVNALSPQARSLFNGAGGGISVPELQQIQVDRIDAARLQISQLTQGVPIPGIQQNALGAFDRLQGLGQQAAGLQGFIVQQQLGLATAQFDEQIRLANLQVSDIAATMNTVLGTTNAVTAANYDNLGYYQGQLILLQRQSAELQLHNQQLSQESDELNQQLATIQLQLQQRQINFRISLAGFATPGQTPQEIAARTREAEIEANYAQRQLNIRKEILANQREILENQRTQTELQARALPLQFKVQDITLQRDYRTAVNALGLLTRARQVTINVAGAQEALSRVNAEIGNVRAELQAYVEAAQEWQKGLIGDAAQYISTYSKSAGTLMSTAEQFFAGIGTAYATSLNRYLTEIAQGTQNAINQLGGGGGGGGNYTRTIGFGSGPGGGAPVYQQGFLGYVPYKTGGTPMIVGEAAGETVAVLKNPKQMLWDGGSAGGGGMQIVLNIHINNPQVSKPEDMDTLARLVARRVEEAISRRGTLLGMRP